MKVEVCKIDEDSITLSPLYHVENFKGKMVKARTPAWLMMNLDCVAECFNRGNLYNKLTAMKVGEKKYFDWELIESETNVQVKCTECGSWISRGTIADPRCEVCKLRREKAELLTLVGAMKKLGEEVTDDLEVWAQMSQYKESIYKFGGCYLCDRIEGGHTPECIITKARKIFGQESEANDEG